VTVEPFDPDLAARLERIKRQDASDTARALASRIQREVDATRDSLQTVKR
jgi:hypothetical protein